MTNALRLGHLDIIRFENVKRRRLFYRTCKTVPECSCGNNSIYRHGWHGDARASVLTFAARPS